jgi:hypothetical protein
MIFAADFALGEALWTVFVFFLFMLWLWLLISIFSDLFRDHETSGWTKALWFVAILLLPFLSAFLYLLFRGDGMAKRSMRQHQAAQEQFDDYVRQAAGTGGAASEIANAKSLLDDGAITQQEYDEIKRKALA